MDQYVTSVFALLLVVSLFAGWYAPDVSVNTDKVFVNTTVCDTVDVSSINDKLDQVQVTLDEDELWTTEAEFFTPSCAACCGVLPHIIPATKPTAKASPAPVASIA